MTKNWFLLQFKPNSHHLAERNLHRQGFETFLPMRDVTQRKSTRFVNNRRPLFPGYMFVTFNIETGPWYKINGTLGVAKLVSFNGILKAVPLDLVTGLIARCDASGILRPPEQLAKGSEVQVLSGPFANFIATVDTIDDKQRIWLIMELMGQSARIAINQDKLKIV